MKVCEMPLEGRSRERMRKLGCSVLSDAELLGGVSKIRNTFIDFQRHLFEETPN